LDIRQLEVFVSVCRSGSFSKAAKELYLTQPTVSSHIVQLEKELGTHLFERRGRNTVPTEAGERLYPYALGVLDLMQKTRESFSAYTNEYKGTIQIVASQTPGNYLLPRLLKTFQEQFPEIRMDLSILNSEVVIEKLLNYEADIGFVGSEYDNDQLELIPFEEDHLVVIASQQSPLKNKTNAGGEIRIEDILGFPFVLRKRGSATLKTFEKTLVAHGGRELGSMNIVMEVDSIEGVKNFVKEDLGVSVLSHHCISDQDELLSFNIEGMELKRQFYSVHHKNRVMSPSCQALLRLIKEK